MGNNKSRRVPTVVTVGHMTTLQVRLNRNDTHIDDLQY